MRTSSAKAKGRRCSQEAKDLIVDALKLDQSDIEVTPSGVTGADLWMSKTARDAFPFSIECKNQEALNVWSALIQASSHDPDLAPILFFKRNRTELYVALKAKDFLHFYKKPLPSEQGEERTEEKDFSDTIKRSNERD